MGFELIGNNGKELHINFPTRDLFDKLTAGWWPLLGIPQEIDEHDCKMLARVLTNYVLLQKKMSNIYRKIMHWDAEGSESLLWLLNHAVPFFNECGGCKREE
jgi:hypothetical protein